MSAYSSPWSAVLDAMEERLHTAQRLLEGEDVPIDLCVPALATEPLPPILAGRARALLDATIQMEARIDEAMAGLASRVADGRRSPGLRRLVADRPAPSYFDRTA